MGRKRHYTFKLPPRWKPVRKEKEVASADTLATSSLKYVPDYDSFDDLWWDRYELRKAPKVLHPEWQVQLPVAVYGTLRKGQGLHRMLEGAFSIGSYGTLPDIALLGANRSFPYIMDYVGYSTRVEVYDIYPDMWADTIASLDQVEGFHADTPYSMNHHYLRVKRNVTLDSGVVVQCWCYMANIRVSGYATIREVIPGGDWVKRERKGVIPTKRD